MNAEGEEKERERLSEVYLWENGLICIVTWCEWPLLGRFGSWKPVCVFVCEIVKIIFVIFDVCGGSQKNLSLEKLIN